MTNPDFFMTEEQFNLMLEAAAQRGAEVALSKIGLQDAQAVHDVRDLRSLLSWIRDAQSTFWKTVIRVITTAMLTALLIGFGRKYIE